MRFSEIHDFIGKCSNQKIVFCTAFLSLFLSLFCWNLEPTVSRDGLLYLELVQVWHDHGSFQAVLEYWPRFWIPPFPLYLMKLLTDCGIPAEAAGVGLNIAMG